LVPIVAAAQLIPPTATNRAIEATTIAGEGRSLRLIWNLLFGR
jgi:hypothetical protein